MLFLFYISSVNARYRDIIGKPPSIETQYWNINSVEPEVIVPQEVINLPEFIERDVDLSCLSVPNLPNGGSFSSPGWNGKSSLV